MCRHLTRQFAPLTNMEILMRYVDGFLLPVPRRNIESYRRMARAAGRIWIEHGALEFRECAGDDLEQKEGMGTSFTRMLKLRRNETAFFSFITFKSRAHRDRVNARVLKDPRMDRMMKDKKMPFDVKRMAYGGFRTLVDL